MNSINYKEIEAKCRELWSSKDLDRPKFTILMPPPNLTGALHIGHFLTYSIQDFIVRYTTIFENRLGVILPGFDHGGISGEYSAIRTLGLKKHDQDLFEKIKEFAQSARKTIESQINQFAFQKDDKYMSYTMDDFHQSLVSKAFINFYNQGLIYRKRTIASYDILQKTCVSDLEIEHKEEKGYMYKIAYQVKDRDELVYVETTRPETIFADVALGFNPEDERYRHLEGCKAIVPIINREIPIITTPHVAIDQGTGLLKITPAHSLVDWQIGLENNLDPISIIDRQNFFNNEELEGKAKEFHGMPMDQLKSRILDILNPESREIIHSVPYARGKIEYILEYQWFFSMEKGALLALEKIEDLKIYPEYWKNTYKSWLVNIKDWCISRTITWGHRLPVYYKKENPSQYFLGKPDNIDSWIPSEEVVDTWFSSALWPEHYRQKYGIFPTDVLVTAYDIIFFWVARMVMVSLLINGELPFKNVFIHRLVRDAKGQKMSKTVGNVIDPMDLTENHGQDNVRIALLCNVKPNVNIRFGEEQIKKSQAITTKIWNLGFYVNNYCKQEGLVSSENKWIEEYFCDYIASTADSITNAMATYEIHIAIELMIEALYEICDWLVELHKIRKDLSKLLKNCFKNLLLIIHPLCPFITQYLFVDEMQGKLTKTSQRTGNKDLFINFKQNVGYLRFLTKTGCKFSIDPSTPNFDLYTRFSQASHNSDHSNSHKNLNNNGINLLVYEINEVIVKAKIKKITEEIARLDLLEKNHNEKTPQDARQIIIINRRKMMEELQWLINLIECARI